MFTIYLRAFAGTPMNGRYFNERQLERPRLTSIKGDSSWYERARLAYIKDDSSLKTVGIDKSYSLPLRTFYVMQNDMRRFVFGQSRIVH
jgi:hypothetical protein